MSTGTGYKNSDTNFEKANPITSNVYSNLTAKVAKWVIYPDSGHSVEVLQIRGNNSASHNRLSLRVFKLNR
jgi:hypothetical protein